MGFEPTTFGTTIRHSNQLSYTHHKGNAKVQFFLIQNEKLKIFFEIFTKKTPQATHKQAQRRYNLLYADNEQELLNNLL